MTPGSTENHTSVVRKSHANKTYIEKESELNRSKFRKGSRLSNQKKGDEGTAPARSHRAPTTTRKRKAEAETREQKGRGVTFSPNGEGTTNKQDVRERYQQVTPTSMIPKSGQENIERGTNVPPSTTNQAHTQKRIVKNKASKQQPPAYIGKPLTQDEIDEKRRRGLNASGFTPLSHIIPASHWQELEAKASTQLHNGNGSSNGNGNHYHTTTKNAPISIDATMEQLSNLLHDEPENTAQNINRAAKLCREAGLDHEQCHLPRLMARFCHD